MRSTTWNVSAALGLVFTTLTFGPFGRWAEQLFGEWFSKNSSTFLYLYALIAFVGSTALIRLVFVWWHSRSRFNADEHWNI